MTKPRPRTTPPRPKRPAGPIRALFLLACLATSLPLWLVTYPPMVDLPQHAAQLGLLQGVVRGDPDAATVFAVNPLTPYWSGYVVAALFGSVLPIVLAVKLVVALGIVLLPLAASALRRELGGDPAWDWLFLPIGYGFAFDWGFLNFLFAAPLFVWCLVAFVRYARNPMPTRAAWVTVLLCGLWWVHMLYWAAGSALAAILVCTSGPRGRASRLLPLLPSLALSVTWFWRTLAPTPLVASGIQWGLAWARPFQLLASAIGLAVSPVAIASALIALGLPLLGGARFRREPSAWLPFVAFGAGICLAPDVLFTNAHSYQRFGMFLLPMWMFVLEPARPARPWAAAAAGALSAVLLIGTCLRMAGFERESADYRVVQDAMPPHRHVAMLAFDRSSAYSSAPVYVHFPAWYAAERGGLCEFTFAVFGLEIVRFRPRFGPVIPMIQEWVPQTFDWKVQGRRFDLIVVRGDAGWTPPPEVVADPEFRLVRHVGRWWLIEHASG